MPLDGPATSTAAIESLDCKKTSEPVVPPALMSADRWSHTVVTGPGPLFLSVDRLRSGYIGTVYDALAMAPVASLLRGCCDARAPVLAAACHGRGQRGAGVDRAGRHMLVAELEATWVALGKVQTMRREITGALSMS